MIIDDSRVTDTVAAKVVEFTLKDGKKFVYSYTIAKCKHSYKSLVTIKRAEQEHAEYEAFLPMTKKALMGTIGCWIRYHMWEHVTQDLPKRLEYGMINPQSDFRFPFTDPKLRKLKGYIYLRSLKSGQVIGGKIYKEWLGIENTKDEEVRNIEAIAYKLNCRPKRMQEIFKNIYVIKSITDPDLWRIIKSDLLTYSSSVCKWILSRIDTEPLKNLDKEFYDNILKTIPSVVKRCKYGFEWHSDEIEFAGKYNLQNRWQWFCVKVAMKRLDHATYHHVHGNRAISAVAKFLEQLPKSDIAVWHYYKKAHHLKKPYSLREIESIAQIIYDGDQQYKEYGRLNGMFPVEGSPLRMIKAAILNHRAEQKISIARKLSGKDFELPRAKVELPSWLELVRIKTAHELITAGIECEHCIGGYTHRDGLYFRYGNVCAQVSHELEVLQCYDFKNQVTNESVEFERKMNKSFIALKKEAVPC